MKIANTFYWGTATAAMQVEGGLDDLTDYGLMASITGGPFKERAGKACDQYALYSEDIALMAKLGFNAYRFSIEWARIEPVMGHFNDHAIEHYRRVIQACRRHGIAPIVTLHHFSSPRWLIAQGGWEGEDTPQLFGRYVSYTVEQLGGEILGSEDSPGGQGAICTFNEINTGALNNVLPDALHHARQQPWVREAAKELGVSPERFTPWSLASSDFAMQTILRSHYIAVEEIKRRYPKLLVGLTLASQNVVPISQDNEEVVASAQRYWQYVENRFLKNLAHNPTAGDFVGVQSYTRTLISKTPSGHIGVLREPNARRTQMGYEFHPQSLGVAIDNTFNLTGLPIIVTECGIGTQNDIEREEYYDAALKVLLERMNHKIPVKGWFAWSFLDNYEWEYGFEKRFGLIHVDYATQRRSVKPSARWLGERVQQLATTSVV